MILHNELEKHLLFYWNLDLKSILEMKYNSFCIKTQFLEHSKPPENVKNIII